MNDKDKNKCMAPNRQHVTVIVFIFIFIFFYAFWSVWMLASAIENKILPSQNFSLNFDLLTVYLKLR